MSFWERDTYALIKDFGSDVQLQDGRILRGIFETKTEFIQGFTEVPIAGDGTTLTVDSQDVGLYQLKKGVLLIIDSMNYKIKSVKNDLGISILDLEKSK
jgi:hypothetical protein